MRHQVVAFTRCDIVVADGAIATANLAASEISGQSVVFITKSADNIVLAIEIAKNINDLHKVASNAVAGDLNENVKEPFASALGMMAATASIGGGPAAAADTLMSEAFSTAYDTASNWSSQQDWSPLFDFIE